MVLVDDDADVRRLVGLFLAASLDGVRVVGEATTAAEAIELLQRIEPPDVIILDHYLHGELRGLDAAAALQAVAPPAEIILLTSHDLAAEAAREPAVAAYVRKDDFDELVDVVRRLLGRPGG